MSNAPVPGSEMSVAVRGYKVTVHTEPDGTLHISCPELPQLRVREQTLASALARAEDAIGAIWAGEFERPEGARHERRPGESLGRIERCHVSRHRPQRPRTRELAA